MKTPHNIKGIKLLNYNYLMKIILTKWVLPGENFCDPLVNIFITALSNTSNFYEQFHDYILTNRFINETLKQQVIHELHNILRRRRLGQKFLTKWYAKTQKLVYVNSSDLLLEEFESNLQYPYVSDKNRIYRFSSSDVHNLIMKSIVFSQFQEPSILPVKNPYTQKVLEKNQLYNLYISSHNLKSVHWLLKEYAHVAFDNKRFLLRHYNYLREKAIYSDIINHTDKEFRYECEELFKIHIVRKFENIYIYSGLHDVPIHVLRNICTPIIVESYVQHDIYTISHEAKKQLIKIWELYPWILKCKNNSSKKINQTSYIQM